MKTPRTNKLLLGLVAAASLAFTIPGVRASDYSLAGDFSLASNPNGAWTYQLEVTPEDDDTAYTPMNTNTRTANEVWGTTFAAPRRCGLRNPASGALQK